MAIKFKPITKKNPVTKAVAWYPQVLTTDRITVDRIAREIEESCTLHESDIKAVIAAFSRRIVAHLQDGNSVNLGDLGSFRTTVRGYACETSEEVCADSIRSARVVYTPSGAIRKALRAGAAGVRFLRAGK